MKRWVAGAAWVLVCAAVVGCNSSKPPMDMPGGTGGTGGAGGTGGVGADGGTGGVGADGGTGGTGGTGGIGGDSGMGGDSGTGGTGGTGGVGDPNDVAANQVCQRLAELQCAAEASCCTDDGRKYPSMDACITSQRQTCEGTFQVTRIGNDPAAGYSRARAKEAFDNFEVLVSNCDTNVVAWGTSPQGFLRMMQGTRSQNALCMPTMASDVGEAFACYIEQGLTCVPGFAGVGSLPPTGWTCKPFSNAGGKCYSDLNCNPGLYCEVPDTFSECVARKADGANCDGRNQCASLFCENNTCVPPSINGAYCLGG